MISQRTTEPDPQEPCSSVWPGSLRFWVSPLVPGGGEIRKGKDGEPEESHTTQWRCWNEAVICSWEDMSWVLETNCMQTTRRIEVRLVFRGLFYNQCALKPTQNRNALQRPKCMKPMLYRPVAATEELMEKEEPDQESPFSRWLCAAGVRASRDSGLKPDAVNTTVCLSTENGFWL